MIELKGLKFYTLSEVLEMFDMNKDTLRVYKQNGKLPYRKIGKMHYMSEDDLLTFFDNMKVDPNQSQQDDFEDEEENVYTAPQIERRTIQEPIIEKRHVIEVPIKHKWESEDFKAEFEEVLRLNKAEGVGEIEHDEIYDQFLMTSLNESVAESIDSIIDKYNEVKYELIQDLLDKLDDKNDVSILADSLIGYAGYIIS